MSVPEEIPGRGERLVSAAAAFREQNGIAYQGPVKDVPGVAVVVNPPGLILIGDERGTRASWSAALLAGERIVHGALLGDQPKEPPRRIQSPN